MTKDEFSLRYYRWSIAEAHREFKQDLPLLRIVNDPSALATVQYLESLGADERLAFMLALVKDSNGRALELSGEELTTDEVELVRHYRENYLALVIGFVERRLLDRQRISSKAKKSRLARTVKERLQPYCGSIFAQASRYLWSHETAVAGWQIQTHIDMGGSPDLRYWHSIVHPDQTLPLKDVISLHTWLGFPITQWSLLGEAEEFEAANSIEKLCRHFLTAAPNLLKGLSA